MSLGTIFEMAHLKKHDFAQKERMLTIIHNAALLLNMRWIQGQEYAWKPDAAMLCHTGTAYRKIHNWLRMDTSTIHVIF